jgi:hypothetical protein
MLVGEFLERVDVLLKGGVVYENVQLPKFAHGLLNCVFAEFGVGHVSSEKNAAATLLFHR